MSDVMGWDIGGAHVKAVQVEEGGRVLQAWHRGVPLWKGLDRLAEAVGGIRGEAGGQALRHAVTMTGELADIFPTRAEGVRRIVHCLAQILSGDALSYFSADSAFVEDAERRADLVGSMNWYASAQLVARLVGQGVFVDVGSTTTDLVRVRKHQVMAAGFSDAERLACQELLYTGVVRTPLMSLAAQIEVGGAPCNLMAEHFATTADVYNLLGQLPDSLFPFETADGAGCSRFESARRVARMIGRDCEAGEDLGEWVRIARIFADLQQGRILESLRTHGTGDSPEVLIGAGTGRFVLPTVAARCGLRYQDIEALLQPRVVTQGAFTLADCLPAYSVAELYRLEHACLLLPEAPAVRQAGETDCRAGPVALPRASKPPVGRCIRMSRTARPKKCQSGLGRFGRGNCRAERPRAGRQTC